MGEIKFKKFLNHIEEEMHVYSICRYYQGIYDFRVIQMRKKPIFTHYLKMSPPYV